VVLCPMIFESRGFGSAPRYGTQKTGKTACLSAGQPQSRAPY
jgi:hypothetical protein